MKAGLILQFPNNDLNDLQESQHAILKLNTHQNNIGMEQPQQLLLSVPSNTHWYTTDCKSGQIIPLKY